MPPHFSGGLVRGGNEVAFSRQSRPPEHPSSCMAEGTWIMGQAQHQAAGDGGFQPDGVNLGFMLSPAADK